MTSAQPAPSAVRPSGPPGPARLVWIEFPIALARYAPRLASAFTDGQHLLKWPAAAAAGPVAAMAVGVAAEYFQASEVFTTSWAVIIVMAAVGLMSVQLGAWAFIGYVASDWLSGRAVGAAGRSDLPDQLDWMGSAVSAAVEYLLLGLLVIGLPSLVLSGRLTLRRHGLHRSLGVVGERVAHVAMIAIGSWLWCQLVITAVRTVFTFGGWPEQTPAVFTTQEQWPIITVSLAAAGVARFTVEALARHDQALPVAIETQQRLTPHLAGSGHVPWRRMSAQTVMGVLLLGGLIDTWQQVVVTAGVYLYVAVARRIIAPSPFGTLISRVSILVRLAIALAISFVVLTQMTEIARQGPERGFFVPWLAVMLSLLIIGLATITAPPPVGESHPPPGDGPPGGETPQRWPTARQTTTPSTPDGSSGLARRIVTAVMLPLVIGFGSATPASADNCAALTDCFTTQSALLVALGVLLIALAVVLVVATAPVSAPALAGGGLLFGGTAALTTTELAALGAVAAGGTLIGTQAPELIQDLSQRPMDDAPSIELDFNLAAASADQPAINGEIWETDIPRPPDPLDAEVKNIAEHGWGRHPRHFPEIESAEELEEIIKETVEHAAEWGQRPDGSQIWYDEVTDTVVIKNPNGQGTTYRPGVEE